MRTPTSIPTFVPLPCCLSLPARTTRKKIPQLPLHFSFKEVQTYFQHLIHPSHGAVLPWGELWAPRNSARGKSYTHTLGNHPVHTGALKVQVELSPPPALLGFVSWICSWICTMLCSNVWPILARDFSSSCLAEGHHTLQQGTTGECKWGGGSKGLAVWSQLVKCLSAQPREVSCTWSANSAVFRTSPGHPASLNFLGHHGHFSQKSTPLQGKTYSSMIRDTAAHLAAFSFILFIKDLY